MNRRSFIKTSVGMAGTTFVAASLLTCEKYPFLRFMTGSITGSITGSTSSSISGSGYECTSSYYPKL